MTQDTRHKTQDTRHKTQDTRHKTQDTRHKTQDTRHKTQDTRHSGNFPQNVNYTIVYIFLKFILAKTAKLRRARKGIFKESFASSAFLRVLGEKNIKVNQYKE